MVVTAADPSPKDTPLSQASKSCGPSGPTIGRPVRRERIEGVRVGRRPRVEFEAVDRLVRPGRDA